MDGELLGLGHRTTTSSTRPISRRRPATSSTALMYDRLNAPGGMEKMTEFYVGLQPWGTPEQVLEKISHVLRPHRGDSFIGVFRYGGMPVDVAEPSMRLFAEEVMPELQALAPVEERLGVAT